jgi:hypothetical protein
LRDAYARVRGRVSEAAVRSGRKAGDVVLVAVTKTAGPDQVRQLVEMGQRDFGENRVQQLLQRVSQLQEYLARKRVFTSTPPQGDWFDEPGSAKAAAVSHPSPAATPGVPRWHMIGHLQRNKVKLVVPLVKLIHGVDTLRLAEELHAFGARQTARAEARIVPRPSSPIMGEASTYWPAPAPGSGAAAPGQGAPGPMRDYVIDILIQVNASGEETKFGVALPAVLPLAEQIDSMMHLRLRGLMTIAPYSEDPEASRPVFARVAELFGELRAAKIGGPPCNILSMGMSGDFEVAIEEGANMVRIGRAIFGEAEGPRVRAEDLDKRTTAEPADAEDDAGAEDPAEPVAEEEADQEGPRSAEVRRRQRLASEKQSRARIARENRSARGGNG